MLLSDLTTISAGYPFRGKLNELFGATVLAVQMKDIDQDGRLNWQSCAQVELTGKKAPMWLAPGDVLFAARGNRNFAALVESEPMAGYQAVATPYFYLLRSKSDLLMPEYLTWWINQAPCQRYFAMNAEGTLTKSVRAGVLASAPLVVPSLAEQQAICHLVHSLKKERKLLQMQLNSNVNLQNALANKLLAKGQEKEKSHK